MLNVARVRPSNLARSWTWNPFRAQGNRVRGPDPSMCKRVLDGLCSGRSPRCACACSVRRPRSPWHRFARAARSQAGQACLLSAGWHRSSAVAGTVFLVPLGELCACAPSPVCRSRAGLPPDGGLVAAQFGRASGRARSRPHPLVLGAMAAPKRSRCGEAVVWAFVALVSSCCVPALGWPRLLARPCASSARRRVPPSSCRGPEPRAAAAARCVVCAVVPFAGPV